MPPHNCIPRVGLAGQVHEPEAARLRLISWLTTIECKAKLLKFVTQLGEEVTIPGIGGDPKLQLVTATKLLKAYCKKKMVYAVKLNPLEIPKPSNEPTWLVEYADVFPEELTQLPLPRDVDHAIDLILGAQPIARRTLQDVFT